MRVRGWLILGGLDATNGLPSEAQLPTDYFPSDLPNAAAFPPGSWFVWKPTGLHALVVVCVDVPL